MMPKDRQHGRSRSRQRNKVNLEAIHKVMDIQAGSIFWLPSRAECLPNDRGLTGHDLDEAGYYDHQVVIYAVESKKKRSGV